MAARMEQTRYGFKFGATEVERLASQAGYVIIGLKTPRQRVDITVTPTGLIRVGPTVANEERQAPGGGEL